MPESSAAVQERPVSPTSQLPSTYRTEVESLDKALLSSRPDATHPKPGMYMVNLDMGRNVREHPGAVIWDIGSRSGAHLYKLRSMYGDFVQQYAGINPVALPLPEDLAKTPAEEQIPIFQGYMEQLGDPKLQEQAKKKGVWPPTMMLLNNVLKYPLQYLQEEGLNNALQTMLDVLSPKGVMLIYEDTGQNLYPKYEEALHHLAQKGTNTKIERRPGNGRYPFYLHVTKEPQTTGDPGPTSA